MRLEGYTQDVGVLLQLRGLQWGMVAPGESQEMTPQEVGVPPWASVPECFIGGVVVTKLVLQGSSEATHSGCSAGAEPLQVSPSDSTPDTPIHKHPRWTMWQEQDKKLPSSSRVPLVPSFAKVQHCIHCGKEMCKEAKIPFSQNRYREHVLS